MKIDKEIFDSLLDESTPVGKYKTNLRRCDIRVGEVALLVFKDITKGSNWFDYDNGHGNEDGEFDPEEYEEEIRFTGKFPEYQPYYSLDSLYIPTRWLWTDDEEILAEYNREVDKYQEKEIVKKNKERASREERKRKKEEMKKSILAKLTEEELKYIDFK
jgi:hypothetical protein